jgi:hypothetical protein
MAVAPPLIGRVGWPLAAAAAFVFLAALALHGERPEPGLARFKPAGLLTAFAPEEARQIEIAQGGETWRFRRDGTEWRAVAPTGAVPADAGAHIDAALRLLRDAGPLRTLAADEIARAPVGDYALGEEALRVTVRGPDGATFAIRFGNRNPMGTARYARIDGVDGMPLMPAYAAEPWERAVGLPPR